MKKTHMTTISVFFARVCVVPLARRWRACLLPAAAALLTGLYSATSSAIVPALVGFESNGIAIPASNTPNVTDGTHFGTSSGSAPLVRTYKLVHAYTSGPYSSTNATISSITSASTDFVVDMGTCTNAVLGAPNPSCTFSVSYLPVGTSAAERTTPINFSWYQGSSLQSSRNVAGSVFLAGGCNHDVDADGMVASTTDGVILLRAMAGITGSAVTQGAIGAGAARGVWIAAINPTPGNSIRLFLNAMCGNNFAP